MRDSERGAMNDELTYGQAWEQLQENLIHWWESLQEILQPIFEELVSQISAFCESISREVVFASLPTWLPLDWRLWVRDHWPKRALPRIGGFWFRRVMMKGEQ